MILWRDLTFVRETESKSEMLDVIIKSERDSATNGQLILQLNITRNYFYILYISIPNLASLIRSINTIEILID